MHDHIDRILSMWLIIEWLIESISVNEWGNSIICLSVGWVKFLGETPIKEVNGVG